MNNIIYRDKLPHGGSGVSMTTAQLQLKPPDNFDFKQPDNWLKWKKRFEQFRHATGLAKDDETRQVSTLMYCLGEEAEDVLTSTNVTEDERKSYASVLAKFDDYFKVRKNVIFERARFNRRNQQEGESIEEYITALYALVQSCDYGTLQEQLLRDRIVVGIRDTALSERMQVDAELTLEKAKKMARQREAVSQQGVQLRGDGSKRSPVVIESVGSSKEAQSTRRDSGRPLPATNTAQCTRCGQSKHEKGSRCPAKEAVCHKCNRKGHYSKKCFSKTVAAGSNELSLDTAFVGALRANQGTSWTTTLLVEKKPVSFKLDTGAEVTAISEQTYLQLGREKLLKSDKVLYGPARQTLDVLGKFTTTIQYQQRETQQAIFVVRGLQSNLLGLPAIASLKILLRAHSIYQSGEDIRKEFPRVFNGLGTLGEEYVIKMKEDAVPYALYTPRNVAMPLREKVREELQRMEVMGVISPIHDPTPWCAGMVVVPKRSGAIRICVDLKPLNQSVMREVHPIPKVDDTLAQLAGAKLFSKLDANSGFWQIPLAKESRPLTAFITPFGRYCFNKLPFGISSAPELFQRRINQILEGLEGVLCQMDDVLIHGKNTTEHDARLNAVLKRLEAAGVTLNSEKCEFSKERVKFLGYVIDREGIRADPEKTTAILQMKAPTNVTELRRFLGMANQLGKFTPRLSELSQPLRELLSAKCSWTWGCSQRQAFAQIKSELTQPTVLALYDPRVPTKISADASSYGLGAVILQEISGSWKPVAYASRSMSETEKRYAQIEKEALAVVWACDRFSDYILGRPFWIETDHKPLVPILNTKNLDNLPPRVLRFRLRLARFEYTVQHVPGKLLYTADALSRAPVGVEVSSLQLQDEVEAFIENVTHSLPATASRLETFKQAQGADPECSEVMKYCLSGWPTRKKVPASLIPYWKARNYLTLYENLLLFNRRIVVPVPLREEIMGKIHAGHQGIERCRMRANTSVWWPSVIKDLTEMIQRCSECAREATPRREPLLVTPLPEYPWQVIGTDLFELKGEQYLIVVDYFSRYPEIAKLSTTTSSVIITMLKSMFARHGVPEVVRSDNGPQYSSHEFSQFSESYGFEHITSSPRYPQSNGQAERAVQTVKCMIKQSTDPYLALLNYRATPLPWCKLSPAELLMGRRLRTCLPLVKEQLLPKWPYLGRFRELNLRYKEKQKREFDKRHRTKDMAVIPDNTKVWISSDGEQTKGTVASSANSPRSYLVDTQSGTIRRNRHHLKVDPSPVDNNTSSEAEPCTDQPSRIVTRSQTGTPIQPPQRLYSLNGEMWHV